MIEGLFFILGIVTLTAIIFFFAGFCVGVEYESKHMTNFVNMIESAGERYEPMEDVSND